MSLSASVYACITLADKVDLTSNWCFSTSAGQLTIQFRAENWTSKKGVWPTTRVYVEPSVVTPSFGAHGEEETPVLIPNTEVKLPSGDYTAKVGN